MYSCCWVPAMAFIRLHMRSGKDARAAELARYKKAEEFDLNKLVVDAKATTTDLRSASATFKDLLVTNIEYVKAKEQLVK